MKNKNEFKIAIIIISIVLALSFVALGTLVASFCFIIPSMNERDKENELNESLVSVLPDGANFKQLDITSYVLPETVTKVYTEANGGYVIELVTDGYSSDLVIMCGVNAQGEITGATCISSNETFGVEKTYGDNVKGYTVDNIDSELDTISGATMTTTAYKNALKDALNTTIIISGTTEDEKPAESDLIVAEKNEEEILSDGQFFVYLERNNGERRLKTILDKPGLVPQPHEPNRDGYVFKGWYQDSNFIIPWNFETDIADTGTVIYAKWESQDYPAFNIKVRDTQGGRIEVNPNRAKEGEVIIIRVYPDEGKRLVSGSVTINGLPYDVLSFVMPGEDVVVSASFENIY